MALVCGVPIATRVRWSRRSDRHCGLPTSDSTIVAAVPFYLKKIPKNAVRAAMRAPLETARMPALTVCGLETEAHEAGHMSHRIVEPALGISQVSRVQDANRFLRVTEDGCMCSASASPPRTLGVVTPRAWTCAITVRPRLIGMRLADPPLAAGSD